MVNETPVPLDGLTVAGVAVRTANRAEADPETASIPALWQRFFKEQKRIPSRRDQDVIIAVYTAYESDHTGEYSLIVGAEVSAATVVPQGLVSVDVPPGRYLVFTAEGEMPAALINTWIEIWESSRGRRTTSEPIQRISNGTTGDGRRQSISTSPCGERPADSAPWACLGPRQCAP